MTDPMEDLETHVRRIWNMDAVSQIMTWDQEVMMPAAGVEARSQQSSAMDGLVHRLLTDDAFRDCLDRAEAAAETPADRAIVREVRRRSDRAAAVPLDLVEEISAATSTAVDAWRTAREDDDFAALQPHLERIVALKREYADHIDPDREPYAVLLEDFEPYLDFAIIERIMDRLREEIPPLVDAIAASDADLATDTFTGEFPVDDQEALVRDLVERLGFDFDRGRLDRSSHPVTFGTQFDVRITDRYDEADLTEGLLAGIHECGHALYQLGLPDEHYGTPLGSARELSIHESQSRLWENHVGRSRAFWDHLLPDLQDRFPDALGDATVQDCYEAANQVSDDNPIRIKADELTYHLHVRARFEVGRDLINGDIAVADLPERWNDAMERYLGFRPETDAEGVMQDIHWPRGAFGYFPTYSIGSVLAAQLFDAAREDIPDLDGKIAAGEFGPLLDWLHERVHRHGQRYTTGELVEDATGERPTADHFIAYIEEKYRDLYDL